VKATVKAEWALPPLFRIRQYDRQHRPPLFLIITSVASLGTCAGGGRTFGDLIFFIEKSTGEKIRNCGDQGIQKKFTNLEKKALKSLIKW
jgi:hypothetical protein